MILKLLLALPIAIAVNLLLGTVIATVNVEFDKAKMISGFVKGFAVYAAIGGLYAISLLLPEVEVPGLGTINILSGMTLILSAVLGFYVYQDLQKLAQVFKLKYVISENTQSIENQANGTDDE
ncbi:MAG TPA: hypothetical protein VIK55_05060 [Paludibacter sp.]